MRRTLCLAVLAACCAVALPAAAVTGPAITQTHLRGAPLGKAKAFYTRFYGPPSRLDRLEEGLERLTFTRLKLEVYFRPRSGPGAIGILTWNSALKTALGIGPCSTVRALENAYGNELIPVKFAEKTVAYRLGKLSFVSERGNRIVVVELSGKGRNGLDEFAALNAPECGAPST